MPAIVLCKTVHNTISEHVRKLINKHFGEFGQGHLEQRLKCVFSSFFSFVRQYSDLDEEL